MNFYNYGLFGLFLVCFISSSLWPLGSEAFVIGFIAFNFNPYLVLIVASIGNILGSLSTYYLAYFGGDSAARKFFPKAYKKIESYRPYVQKYGCFYAFFAFLPFIGDVLVLLLGLYRYNQMATWLFIALGKISRYTLLIYLYMRWGIT
ncbi:YqaA family protein [Helicobacter trogontum]|uniref:DedA family protein n=1 Tax=Helicobacter trogontum TaxID=50960 RepID=A0A4U8TAX4_9HELI|nr:VTT domain-containing protein [Helicobacter trogontum]MCI5786350.1 VTT domain-containing protein [Helicobacter trogontum]MDY5185685.1 VTT domain-containing protein [Helicobacter trogontum]TLD97021.1 DedA family protein [Helicobacter trogontum]